MTQFDHAQDSSRLSERLRSHDVLQSIFATSRIAMLLIDPATNRIVEANDAACRLYDSDRESLSGLSVDDVHIGAEEDIRSVFGAENPDGHEQPDLRIRSTDGINRNVEIVVIPVNIGDASLRLCMVFDTSARVSTEDALRQSECAFNDLVAAIDGVVWEANPETFEFLYVSPQSLWVTGFAPEEWYGKSDFWETMILAEDRAATVRACVSATSVNEDHTLEYRLVRKDGTVRWVQDVVSLREDSDGKRRMIGIIFDVTDQKLAQEELSASEAQYRAVVDDQVELICRFDSDLRLLFANPAAERFYNADLNALIGRATTAGLSADEASRDLQYFKRFSPVDTVHVREVRRQNGKGEVRLLRETNRAFFDEYDRLTGFQCVADDITEERQLEERLLVSQRLESVGRLAGGIAHDFNNLLTAIVGYTETATIKLGDRDDAKHELSQILRAADRAAELVKQLLAFAKKQPSAATSIRIDSALSDMIEMLRRLATPAATVTLELTPGIFAAAIDPIQFEQVLVNILVNARDAMPNGGTIAITAENVEVTEGSTLASQLMPGPYSRVLIADTGVGMSESVKNHVFEPFFTTKEPTKGTGLGLATAHGVIAQAGGLITVASEVGVGTTFTVYLPKATPPPRSYGRRPLVPTRKWRHGTSARRRR